MLTGKIFDIQRYSTHDGPGIRTTVFMKGCPLRCRWCHNPEGLKAGFQLKYTDTKCMGCGKCISLCKNHYCAEDGSHAISFDRCTACGKCVHNCPTGALEICGREISSSDLMASLIKDKPFYREKGGVTFSGGECLLQADFVAEMLRLCKDQGLGTAVDTCGYVPLEAIGQTLDYTDIYLYDIKAFNAEIHKKYTGVDNRLILENLKRLSDSGAKIWIRIPVIPGVNDTESEMESISSFAGSLNSVERVTLMPYHAFGGGKYKTVGMTYDFDTEISVPKENLSRFKLLLEEKGLTVK